jgi:methylated-DNA-[protein]-cysteine S-methyltransferase
MKRQAPITLDYDEIASPIGRILIVVDDGKLVALDFADYEARMKRLLARSYGTFALRRRRNPAGLSERVRAYFSGDLDALATAPMHLHGTAFQKKAWRALRAIRPGRIATYAEQARKLGQPQAARAVGHANALNPIAIAVPCHRVIGASRALTGYAGGLDRKRWLLLHEGVAL